MAPSHRIGPDLPPRNCCPPNPHHAQAGPLLLVTMRLCDQRLWAVTSHVFPFRASPSCLQVKADPALQDRGSAQSARGWQGVAAMADQELSQHRGQGDQVRGTRTPDSHSHAGRGDRDRGKSVARAFASTGDPKRHCAHPWERSKGSKPLAVPGQQV